MTSKVLIVDDEPAVRATLEALLSTDPYTFEQAESGPQALEMIQRSPPDVVLLDVMMPGMSGVEVCRRIRALPEACEVPIMILTAFDDREAQLQALDAGAEEFLGKPVDRAVLRARLRTITRLNRYRRLNEERARFHFAVEHSSDGYLITSPSGAVKYANTMARQLLQIPEGTAPTFAELCARFVEQPAQGGGAPRCLVRPETPSERAQWLEVQALGEADARSEPLLRVRDVTDDAVRGARQLRFEALVSHKLRTPVNGILAPLEMVLLSLNDGCYADAKEMAGMALASGQRLAEAVRNVVDGVDAPLRLEDGIGLDGAAIADLADSAAFRTPPVELRVHLEPEAAQAAAAISADSFEPVLAELLANSRRFHPAHTPVVELAISVEPGFLRVCLSDDGGSVAPGEQHRVWRPYAQMERHVSGEAPGMGLGLARVAAVVGSVGGTYALQNRLPGPGITVTLRLPLKVA